MVLQHSTVHERTEDRTSDRARVVLRLCRVRSIVVHGATRSLGCADDLRNFDRGSTPRSHRALPGLH